MDANTIVNLSLPLGSVQLILAALGKQPFEAVAPTINLVTQQVQPQIDAASGPKAPAV